MTAKTTQQDLKDSDDICPIHFCKKEHYEIKMPFTGEVVAKSYCSKCGDDIDRQSIERQRRIEQDKINTLLENAMLAPRFKDKTFENFEFYGTDEERSLQRVAIEKAMWFVENHNKSTGLLLLGKTGNGKNHIASAIVKKLIEQGKSALMTEALKIVRTIKDSWRKEGSETDAIHCFIEPYLLVIDETGVQYGSETEKMYLTEIVNDRYAWLKPTIICGNLTMPELINVIGERAVERFKEDGRVIVFNWPSYRGRQGRL